MRLLHVPLLILACALSMSAVAAPTIQKTTQAKSLLLSAIDAPGGKTQAWLEGEIANRIRNQTKAPAKSPVLATVSTVKEFRPGCKRLRMVLSMPDHKMLTIKNTMEPFTMFYELNLCRDGQPPQASSVGMQP